MAAVVKVPGVSLTLGGVEFVVPPLSLGALEQLRERLAKFTGDIRDGEQIATVIDVLHAALRRNYPDIKRDEIGDMVDLGNFMDVMQAAMNAAGMQTKGAAATTGAPSGEASS